MENTTSLLLSFGPGHTGDNPSEIQIAYITKIQKNPDPEFLKNFDLKFDFNGGLWSKITVDPVTELPEKSPGP